MNREEKRFSIVKAAFLAAGIMLTIIAGLAILYAIFKKHLKITFEDDCFCEDDIDDLLGDSEELFDDCCCCAAQDEDEAIEIEAE